MLLLVLVVFLACSPDSNNSGNNTDLSGLWDLQIIEAKDSSSGEWVEADWMKGGDGLLHYGDDQYMSIHFTPVDYRIQSQMWSGRADTTVRNDIQALASDYWYVGAYSVFREEGFIEHKRLMHSDPAEWGKSVRRKFSLEGDTLVLEAEEFDFRLKWTRHGKN